MVHLAAAKMLSLLSAPTALTMPPVSPTGVANKLWSWRGFNIRYQEVGASNADGPVCILVHGLFVNADHWRRNLPALALRIGRRRSLARRRPGS